ncbi:hypothetical protein ACIQRW_33230 [Streptomyces sp. NPDC091287]|uniref:hypothetical protein n=1 Tax=Streptomyces sp. NPDC091287 TaxID=3365988 RepID=UPI003805802A
MSRADGRDRLGLGAQRIDSRLAGVPEGPADRAREGVANAVEAANGAGPYAQELVRAARQSFVDGWQNAMWAGVAVMAALFLYVLVRGPLRPARTAESAADAHPAVGEPQPTVVSP